MSIVSVNLTENRLVGRREIHALISYTDPLTRDEIKKVLGEHFKTDTANVVLKKAIYQTGTRIISVWAHIYNSLEHAKKYEPIYILIRNKLAEREKK